MTLHLYAILFSTDFVRFLKKLDKKTAKQIYGKIFSILENPYHYTTALVDRDGLKKLRVGAVCILLEIDNGRVLVMIIDVVHWKKYLSLTPSFSSPPESLSPLR